MKVLFILLFLSNSVFAEPELSEEYIALRNQITKEVKKPYNDCVTKESKIKYEMAVNECESQGKGINIGGGCGHVANYNKNYRNAVNYNCEALKPSIEQYKQALVQAVEKRGVNKYK